MKLLSNCVNITALLFLFPVLAGAQVARGAIVAVDEPPSRGAGAAGTAAGGRSAAGTSQTGGSRTTTRTTRNRRGNTRQAQARTPPARRSVDPAKYDGFVIGDKYTFMNFEVVSAEKPYHTREAKAEGAKGLVQVEILIDEDGSVIAAKARTGNKLLHPEAERAALASKFNRPSVYGKPARAIGFLVYRFGPPED
ncbi:MAG TPA: hypothetical protein PKD24_14570 [Pyrinomonadaceae bacterium]|nr:hypothetical protein [Pyrinomonadaceae bacterium]HMP66598.1 hypothetical protein [Pyrinomonadaceae bacterium]